MRLESFRAVAGRTVHIHQIHRVHEEFQKYDLRHPLTPSSFQGLDGPSPELVSSVSIFLSRIAEQMHYPLLVTTMYVHFHCISAA